MGKLSSVPVAAPQSPDPAARTPVRQTLFEAIENYRSSVAEHERVQAALQKLLHEVLFPAEDKVASLTRTIAETQATASRVAAAQFLGDADAVDLVAMRRQLEETKNAVLQAETTRAGLEDMARTAASQVERAKARLNEAHSNAIAADPATASLAERYIAALSEVVKLASALKVTRPHQPNNRVFNVPFDLILMNCPAVPSDLPGWWRDTLARLLEDPDEQLPMQGAN